MASAGLQIGGWFLLHPIAGHRRSGDQFYPTAYGVCPSVAGCMAFGKCPGLKQLGQVLVNLAEEVLPPTYLKSSITWKTEKDLLAIMVEFHSSLCFSISYSLWGRTELDTTEAT